MTIEKEEALEIARKFSSSVYEDEEFPLDFDNSKVRLAEEGFEKDILKFKGEHWVVSIPIVCDPNVGVVSPDELIIVVNPKTGEPKLLPIM